MKTVLKIDPKTRFSNIASGYDYRPSYPENLINWLVKLTKIKPGSIVIDLGCGTGIASILFAKRGFKVIGIDPNKEMLEQAIKKAERVKYQIGDCQKTNLRSGIADLCISAQAFHWFDIDKADKEIKRVLKPDSWCCAFWNVRIKTPFVREYESLIRVYSSDYEKTPKAKDTILAIKKSRLGKSFKEKQFDNSQSFNKEGLIGRAYSTSYVVHGVKDHDEFKLALGKLFDKYQSKGKASFRYKTVAVAWQFC